MNIDPLATLFLGTAAGLLLVIAWAAVRGIWRGE